MQVLYSSVATIYVIVVVRPTLLILSIGGGGGGESDLPSLSVHLASSAVTPAGSVHKSRGNNVVCMWVQLKIDR